MRSTQPTSVRFKPVTLRRITALAKRWESTKAAAIERAILEAAAREKVKA